MHLHRSARDGDLMTRVPSGLDFAREGIVSFGAGSDPRLVNGDPDKAHENVYGDVRKPAP